MVEPYRILIVEDDPEHAELIRMAFRKHDEFFLDFAGTGEDGLEMAANGSYSLISVDLVLPGIGGLDVLTRIRKFDQDIPVVMVSGHGTTEMAVVAFENRATKYVVKSMESFKSLPYIFENLIQETRFKAQERAMRERIERSERIHRNVVENALAGIYILQDGVFKLVNPKLADIFGSPPDKLLGTSFWQLVQPDDMQYVDKLERGASPSPAYESRIQRKDGTTRWIEFRTIPIEYDGKRAILGNLLDITQRKEQEIELLRSNREHAATSSILTRMLDPSREVEKDLEMILADVVSGIGGEVGGIFLQEDGSLVLKSLFGAVEDLITFLETAGPDKLLADPKLHPAENDEGYMWLSAPIVTDGKTRGVLVAASLPDGEGARSLAFVEKAVPFIVRMLHGSSLRRSVIRSHEEVELLSQAGADKGR